jgi:hypothetical protein
MSYKCLPLCFGHDVGVITNGVGMYNCSPVGRWWSRDGTPTLLLVKFDNVEGVVRYLRECIFRDVDEIEFSFHVLRHPPGITCQFFPDVLFERGPAPSSHFLDLCVRVSHQC